MSSQPRQPVKLAETDWPLNLLNPALVSLSPILEGVKLNKMNVNDIIKQKFGKARINDIQWAPECIFNSHDQQRSCNSQRLRLPLNPPR